MIDAENGVKQKPGVRGKVQQVPQKTKQIMCKSIRACNGVYVHDEGQ
jgi:hypothetical protein